MQFNKQKFLSFYLGTINYKNAENCWDAVELAFRDFYKTCPLCGHVKETPEVPALVMVGALATVRVEVGKAYLPISEYAPNSAYFNRYEGRADLGNTIAGDGLKFKGRGLIQLTGRANYTTYGQKLGIDLVSNPDLALDLQVSARIFARYFVDRKVDRACINQDWLTVRKLVNGVNRSTGLPNGWDEFKHIINQFLK